MADTGQAGPRFSIWERYIGLLVVVWTVIILLLAAWNLWQINDKTLDVARIQAQTAFDKDIFYRRWNASYGGVYAPVTADSPPNPYLDNVPEREITTPSGTVLTLINPAYMTRQVHELQQQEQGVLGHITSLDPIRPENAADAWETDALNTFERGATVVSSVESINGEDYMRLMRPLVTESSCLQCHQDQGYKVGDVRGGISVSVPMAPLRSVAAPQKRTVIVGYLLLWLFGTGGIGMTWRKLTQYEQNRQQAESERERLITDLDAYAHSVAHDLKTPLSVITGYSTVLTLDPDLAAILPAEAAENMQEIQRSSLKMNSIIDELLVLASIRKLNEIELHPLNMAYIVGDTLARLAPMIRDCGAMIEMPAADAWPEVASYGPWIEEVWVNYISNALKYGGIPPYIVLGAAPEPETNQVRFWVRDHGPGISKADQARLFAQFSRLDDLHTSDGHGLGLSIVRRIIEKLGGEVGVESAPGAGSTFYFKLPANPSP